MSEQKKGDYIAEAKRSSDEAHRREGESLIVQNVARYMNPPPNTIYPLEYAYHLLGDVRHKTILDLGCGAGENTLMLAHRGANVVGLDLSSDLIEIAKRRLRVNGQKAEFIVSSGYATGLRTQCIDVVFGAAILHHLKLEPIAAEIRRILRPRRFAGVYRTHPRLCDPAVSSPSDTLPTSRSLTVRIPTDPEATRRLHTRFPIVRCQKIPVASYKTGYAHPLEEQIALEGRSMVAGHRTFARPLCGYSGLSDRSVTLYGVLHPHPGITHL
jgi:SAM-dependent methyltransferase